ncbi:MAG TPA: NAD(P)-dependent oxidoreductase [Bryobacteraceae bacterium]|nr:NAD(P)-dependent oxidoreductase [Bryobacteraceae bacterium]
MKTEDAPFDPNPPRAFRRALGAIRYLEQTVTGLSGTTGIALRYGGFYGPGNTLGKGGDLVEQVRKRKVPIIGGGTGVWSFVHIDDAALATVQALDGGGSGVYNIVDDEPAQVSEWLPALAEAVGGKPPFRIPAWVGCLAVGEFGVIMMTQVRGASNARAKRRLGVGAGVAVLARGLSQSTGRRRGSGVSEVPFGSPPAMMWKEP